MGPTHQAQGWLREVQEIEARAANFQRLKTQKNNLPLFIQALPPAVVPLPGSSISMVYEEDTLSEILRLLEDDTTPLKAINDELLHRGPGRFDLIQEEIAARLGYSGPGEGQCPTLPGQPPNRASTLLRALSQRNFLLLLDDLWETLDLGTVGVPFSSSSSSSSSLSHGSKIVFTTR
ncbi:unnamed protein product [Spirodela intermedia]|uniref:NB-ARC domain-containing protein n=1 Tax=Spirodela intermedia TaxID=51605 RepID=A0ABN7E985_SPIIN|nr:unnamed protein product [Spirodela intermedia]